MLRLNKFIISNENATKMSRNNLNLSHPALTFQMFLLIISRKIMLESFNIIYSPSVQGLITVFYMAKLDETCLTFRKEIMKKQYIVCPESARTELYFLGNKTYYFKVNSFSCCTVNSVMLQI